jgi:uncharacterized protein YbaP (TraB family)
LVYTLIAMRILKNLLLLLLLAGTCLTAQEKKYRGLLWEVSGNGLRKNSYLYGSMHVSDKVSYHLSDAFFNRLLAADIVANESEPSTWMDLMGFMGSARYNRPGKLYAGFTMQPAIKENLYPLFRSSNFTMNNLLFRTDETQKEYQEETYLDMFIYRTGRKYKKKTVGLEDTKTSLLNIMNIDYRDMEPREENSAALQKILKNTGYEEALLNYYRDKDLDMLDSLTTLASPQAYLKTLLYDRNVVMVHSIDSLVKTGSLFAAVGAAHLPGKNGIIELLRSKGYTVKPVKDSYTEAGKASKERIEAYFIKPTFTKYTTTDGIVSLPLFSGAVIENLQDVQSPDLANGGFINVKRLLLKDFLNKNNKQFNHQTLDSLFYENIPGKIIYKKQYNQDGYYVYDVKNVTKTGNMQRYRYYVSPLEVIAVSMAGEKKYVQMFENEVFNNIIVKPVAQPWSAFSPAKGGFTVALPGYRAVYGDNEKSKAIHDASLYAYNPVDKAAYFVIERTLGDNESPEDTAFELKRIHYEFYNALKIDSTQTKLDLKQGIFTSASKIGIKDIQLKSVINGAKYYVLGSVGASNTDTQRFFNSFVFTPTIDKNEYKVFTDTVANYTINIPKAANEKLDFEPTQSFNESYEDKEKVNLYKDNYGTRQFTMASGQQASVFYHQYHRYRKVVSIDSLWTGFKKYITEDDDTVTGYATEDYPEVEDVAAAYAGYNSIGASVWDKIINKKAGKTSLINEVKRHVDNGNYDTYQGLAVTSNSNQAIKFKAYYSNGTSYLVSTLVDKEYKNDDPAIEKIFSSFTIKDNPKAEKLPEDRIKLFIEDANSEHDSIRSSALASIQYLTINKNDLPALQSFIENFEFTAEETGALTELYTKLTEPKDAAVLPFFEKQYKRDNSNTIIQFAVLKALATFKSDEGYKKIKELLEYDLPVSDNSYEVADLFGDFGLDTEHSAILFPDVLQYYSIPEYHVPVVAFTARLLEDNAIKPKKLKSYKKMLLTNTRLEIKRAKSRKANAELGSENRYDDRVTDDTTKLENYMELLYAFKKDKEVAKVFAAIKALNIKEANLQLVLLDIKNDNADEEELKSLLNDPATLFPIQKILTVQKKTALLKNITDEQLAASAVTGMANINAKTDNLTFLDKKVVSHNGTMVSFYFFKIKKITPNATGYNRNPEKLAAVAFVNNGNRINPAAYKNAGMKRITPQDDLEEYKKFIIDGALNANKSRATFGNGGDNFDGDMFEEEFDY